MFRPDDWHLWSINPALLYGLALLLGWLFAISSPWALIPFMLLCTTAYSKLFRLVLLFLLPLPWLAYCPLQEEGRLRIDHLSYQSGWVYKGTLNHRPVTIYTNEHHRATHDYFVKGKWKNQRQFIAEQWIPIARPRLAEIRYQLKQQLNHTLTDYFQYSDAAQFVMGLVTGHLEGKELKKRCQNLGIGHLLAVSGLHFSILFSSLHVLIRPFFPRKVALGLLWVLLSLYALFIGHTPSAYRAWVFITTYIFGELIERTAFSLNRLGVALLCSLIIYPFDVQSLSFQFSFLATGGIILIYPPIRNLLINFFDLKSHTDASAIRRLTHTLSIFFCDLCAFTLALQLITTPLSIYYFHLFYPHSLFYNLFFPLLAAGSLILLPLYPLCDLYTHYLLKIVFHPPFILSPIPVTVPSWGLTFLITFSITLGLYLKERVYRTPSYRWILPRFSLKHKYLNTRSHTKSLSFGMSFSDSESFPQQKL